MLRRSARDELEKGPTQLTYADVTVDLNLRLAYLGGTQVRLTPTETRLLILLMPMPGRVFTRDQIIERVFGYDFDGFDRTVDAHVSNLRQEARGRP